VFLSHSHLFNLDSKPITKDDSVSKNCEKGSKGEILNSKERKENSHAKNIQRNGIKTNKIFELSKIKKREQKASRKIKKAKDIELT